MVEMARALRILALCYEYPPLGGGGGRVARVVAEGLAARGHEVRLLTAALGWTSAEETGAHGVRVLRTRSGRKRMDSSTVREMGQFLLTSFGPTVAQCRHWRPDVLHAHFAMPTGLLAWQASLFTRVPYVLTAHLGDVPGGVPEQTDTLFRWVGPVARRVWIGAAAATAVSGHVQQLAETAYARPVTRILNGIDLADRPALDSLRVNETPNFLFVGRFNPQKNTRFLIEALATVADVPWTLTMIGDGPDLAAVRERTEALGLGGRLRFLGWRATQEVEEEMARADVLCMPSSFEGLPVAAVEGLKFGLAVAASDIPGLHDVVTHGENGLTAPVGDLAAYAQLLRTMVTDRDNLLDMRRASWRKATGFDLPEIVRAYEEVLLGAARPRAVR